MKKLIKPPVPAALDVRKFSYMPLHVFRLMNSDFMFSVSDAEFRAAILLWGTSWHEVPSGSLPDNDRVLAGIARCGKGPAGLEEWLKIKEGAMWGFELASDGRYYHPLICESAMHAAGQIKRTEVNREQHTKRVARWRANKKTKSDGGDEAPENNENQDGDASRGRTRSHTRDADVMRLKGREGKGKEGTKRLVATPLEITQTVASPASPGDGPAGCSLADLEARAGAGEAAGELFPELAGDAAPAPKAARVRPAYPAAFEEFWKQYPRKVGKDAALKAWKAAGKRDEPEAVKAGAVSFAALCATKGTPEDKIPHPATWLNAGRWRDEGLPALGADGKAVSVRIQDKPGNKMVF